MILSHAKPIDKGVTQLMYVGDDAPPISFRTWALIGVLAIGAYVILGPGKRR